MVLRAVQQYAFLQPVPAGRTPHKQSLRSKSVPAQVFLTHLHSDHHADLASFYVQAMFGRTTPWEVSPCLLPHKW